MRNIRLYFSRIVFRGIIRGAAIALVHILPWILLVAASFAFAKFGQSELTLESRGLLGLMYLLGTCVFTTSKIRYILGGQEILLLKKIGFSGNELFVYCLSKVKIPFLMATTGYACIYGVEAELGWPGAITCLAMSALCFLWAAILSSIYITLFNSQKSTLLKDISIILALAAIFTKAYKETYVEGMLLFQTVEEMVRHLARMRVMDFISFSFFSSFASMAMITLGTALLFWIFFRQRFLKLSVYTVGKPRRRRRSRVRITVGSPLKSFMKRDLGVAFSSKIFMAIQVGAVALGIWASTMLRGSILVHLAIYLAIICWVLSLKIQDVLVVDSLFVGVYKTLPIKFKDFVLMKAALAALYSLPCPLALLAAEFGMGKITALSAIILLIGLMLWSELLFFYNSSIIMLYFPKVKNTTDMPLLLGDFMMLIPLFPVIMIVCGMRIGAKKWRAW
ncbi:MAG: hypothetical protein LBT59_27285 [Clostridiales bacterium]|nr:hypothetical protein [Clostridiales bacterium]